MANNAAKCTAQTDKKWFNRHVIDRLNWIVTKVLQASCPIMGHNTNEIAWQIYNKNNQDASI